MAAIRAAAILVAAVATVLVLVYSAAPALPTHDAITAVQTQELTSTVGETGNSSMPGEQSNEKSTLKTFAPMKPVVLNPKVVPSVHEGHFLKLLDSLRAQYPAATQVVQGIRALVNLKLGGPMPAVAQLHQIRDMITKG